MEERDGNPKCKHKWVYDDIVIDTNPPTYHKICENCGRLEHEIGKEVVYNNFNEIYNSFQRKTVL